MEPSERIDLIDDELDAKLKPEERKRISFVLGFAPEGVSIYTAEAITEVTLCRYKRTTFERLIDEVPGFAKRLLTAASHELRAAQDQMLLLGRKTASMTP